MNNQTPPNKFHITRGQKKSKYLGNAIGPGAGSTSWDAPIQKYISRVDDWPWKLMGTHLSLRV